MPIIYSVCLQYHSIVQDLCWNGLLSNSPKCEVVMLTGNLDIVPLIEKNENEKSHVEVVKVYNEDP